MATLQKTEMGRRERRRAETREKLYQTAMRLFAERGFFETTTEDITEAADVGQGTFFNYFPTKQHVLTALSEKQIEKVLAARAEAESGTSSMHDVLHRLIHRIAQEPGRSQALTRSLISALISNDAVREMVRCNMGRGRENMAAIIALGQNRREIRGDRAPVEVAVAFQRSVFGTLLLWAMQPQGDLHEWLEAAFRDFWAAMGRLPSAGVDEAQNPNSEPPAKHPGATSNRDASRAKQKNSRNTHTVAMRNES